mmetsp:Transcript_69966/g.124621  ORF Transcript_69966/g.124621 Transcript_69966/m.124621 type:complete len:96 (+) Transcript_69966:181-468(+)
MPASTKIEKFRLVQASRIQFEQPWVQSVCKPSRRISIPCALLGSHLRATVMVVVSMKQRAWPYDLIWQWLITSICSCCWLSSLTEELIQRGSWVL